MKPAVNHAAVRGALAERAGRLATRADALAKQARRLQADAEKASKAHDRAISEPFIGRHDCAWDQLTRDDAGDALQRAAYLLQKAADESQ